MAVAQRAVHLTLRGSEPLKVPSAISSAVRTDANIGSRPMVLGVSRGRQRPPANALQIPARHNSARAHANLCTTLRERGCRLHRPSCSAASLCSSCSRTTTCSRWTVAPSFDVVFLLSLRGVTAVGGGLLVSDSLLSLNSTLPNNTPAHTACPSLLVDRLPSSTSSARTRRRQHVSRDRKAFSGSTLVSAKQGFRGCHGGMGYLPDGVRSGGCMTVGWSGEVAIKAADDATSRSYNKRSTMRRRRAHLSKRALACALLAGSLQTSMAQTCISLKGSKACPAFNESSISTDDALVGLFPFLSDVTNTASFDSGLQSYIDGSFAQIK